jgi:hypothetical protein
MKRSALYFLLFFIVLYSCNRNGGDSAGENATPEIDSVSQCFVAVAGADSATLTLKEQGRIEGSLSFYFAEKDDMTGKIAGTFIGDTLYVDYSYRLGDGQEYFQNPLVFLRKDGKLYQGYGEVTSTYGRSHFDKNKPIDFTKGFVFDPVDCKVVVGE